MRENQEDLKEIIKHYDKFDEIKRLNNGLGRVEFIRSLEIIKRYLSEPPAIILDVGGGPGIYSCWLAREGYEVHLIDPVPSHIDQARNASKNQPGFPIASCTVGDARKLKNRDSSIDHILLMGPLYHLLQRDERIKALAESYRVLKNGGFLFAAVISRFASTIDGMREELYQDPEFRKILLQDLKNGRHTNPTNNIAYFTDAYFHHPEEIREEIEEGGFKVEKIIGIECISYLLRDIDKVWENEEDRKFMLEILRKIESEPSLIGASHHIMCVAKKV